MRVEITPSVACGRVTAPPSKSMAHRLLLCGALSEESAVHNVAYSADIDATLGCLTALGAKTERGERTVTLGGLDLSAVLPGTELFCNESGSTLRFLLPLCMLCGVPITVRGSRRLFERPLGVYETLAKEQGIRFERREDSVTVCGRLKSGDYCVPGDISSQFITGLLYALPLLEGESTLTVTGRFESASYIDLTLDALSLFGVEIRREENIFYIRGGQRPQNRCQTVEGDCSNAAFLEALNLLGGAVEVGGISPTTKQGDRVYRTMLADLSVGKREFDLSDCPDLAPVMFAAAAACGGARFTGTARLRFKESDRGAAMAAELAKCGISVTVGENDVMVHSGTLCAPTQPIDGHNDHRIVMAMALLCTVTGGTVCGAEAVAKSYPDFFDALQSLKVGITRYETGLV